MTVVVKLGSTLVVGPSGRVRRSLLRARAREIAGLVRAGEPVCVVSSGAIALGLSRLGRGRRPRDMATLQAASALGQAQLQRAWEAALRPEGLEAAQILLSAGDVADRTAYVNVRRALGGARVLVLLTETEGVYSTAPGTPGAELVHEGGDALAADFGGGSTLGRGGMRSKVMAAQMASATGVATVIASGRGDVVLPPIVAGERRGTRFTPEQRRDSAFKLWLRYGKPVAARLVVDEGARRAVVDGGASLLAVGVVACEGEVRPGDAVELVGPDGVVFGKGIAAVTTEELTARARGVEAVHRDRLVVY